MLFIVVTEVDAITRIPCTEQPMRAGPVMPLVKGLDLDWANMSTWPVELSSDGTYLRAPQYYGVCDGDANTNVPGVLEIISKIEWDQRKYDEFYARQPYPSWIWDPITLTWSSPVPYPSGENPGEYRWDEETLSWVSMNNA